ncbi:Hypothetical protein D9617_3g021800 [Elsinoe fawcettii]|nr:Hypothetical protein D9617_3g021800 [Elsinoe fawcettii]
MARVRTPVTPPAITRHRRRARPAFEMKWTEEKLLTLSAAVIAADTHWEKVCDVWASVHRADAQEIQERTANSKALRNRLKAQWCERYRTRAKKWRAIPKTAEEFERQDSRLIREVRAIITGSSTSDGELRSDNPEQDTAASNARTHSAVSATTSSTQQAAPVTPKTQMRPINVNRIPTPPDTIQVRSQHFSGVHIVSSPSISDADERKLAKRETLLANRSKYFGPYDPVPAELAHPFVPRLVYRMYDRLATHAKNKPATDGYISSEHSLMNGRPAIPKPVLHDDDKLHGWIENHLNERKVPTPFVSVTYNLFWIMQQAFRRSASKKHLAISVIDGPLALGKDGRKAYHCRPYADGIGERYNFDPGKWLNAMNHEFLVWGHIPKDAIIATFDVKDFIQICADLPSMSKFFRLDMLRQPGYTCKVREAMIRASDRPTLDSDLTLDAMAKFFEWIFITSNSGSSPSTRGLTKLVSDLVQGWGILPSRPLTSPEWIKVAEQFVAILKDRNIFHADRAIHHELVKAVLFGFRSGFGEPDWPLKERLQRKMLRKAASYGLGNVDDMMAENEDPLVRKLRALDFQFPGLGTQKSISAAAARDKARERAAASSGSLGTRSATIRNEAARPGPQEQASSALVKSAYQPSTSKTWRTIEEDLTADITADIKEDLQADLNIDLEERPWSKKGAKLFQAVVIPRTLPTPPVSGSGLPIKAGSSKASAITIDNDEGKDYDMADVDDSDGDYVMADAGDGDDGYDELA